ncbi:MAG: ImmA/IrrE family metallo-endopeptidase [Hyphomicrobium sp.]
MDYSTGELVRRAAVEFRQKHDALDWSASVDDLIRLNGLDQGSYGGIQGMVSAIGTTFRRLTSGVTKKVLALFSMKESVILVSNDLPEPKKPFAKGHELGHSVIEWHREILYVCDEHDLAPGTRAQMEFEANTFAAEVLCPRPLVQKVYALFPTDMNTVIKLKEWSGASIETCAQAYVDGHPGKVVLAWLDEEVGQGGSPILKLTRKRLSGSAVGTALSTLTKNQVFDANHAMFTESRTRCMVQATSITIGDSPKRYRASVFNNGYRVMVLLVDES